MLAFINMLIFFALGLANVVLGLDDPYDKDIWEHHGYALAETWIGRAARNAGDLTGKDLNDQLLDGIKKACHSRPYWCWSGASPMWLKTHHVLQPYDPEDPEVGEAWLGYTVEYEFTTNEALPLLLKEAVRILAMLTQLPQNFTIVKGQRKPFANLPEFIRINMPRGIQNKRNFLEIRFFGSDNIVGPFRCCATRWVTDKIMDREKNEMSEVFWNMDYSRDTRCLIKGSQTCEECGAICNECRETC